MSSSVQAFEEAEAWAGANVALLRALLEDPNGKHSSRGVFEPNSFLTAHLIGLFSQLSVRHGSTWIKQFQHICAGGRTVALHVWLHHLCPSANILQPTGKAADFKNAFILMEREVSSFVYRKKKIMSMRNKVMHANLSTSELDDQLRCLYDGVLVPFNFGLLPCVRDAPTPPECEAERFSVSSMEAQIRMLLLKAVCSASSPFFILAGHGNIVSHICKLACGNTNSPVYSTYQRALPQKQTLQALYLSHAEVIALREQLSEKDALIKRLQREMQRAVRREAYIAQLLEEAGRDVEKAVRDGEEKVQV